MLSPVLRHHLLALIVAAGLFAPGIGCKSARPTPTTACPPLANSCGAPVTSSCKPNPGCCQLGQRLVENCTAGNCDCAPHNPLDPYNRCGVATTPPPSVHVTRPALPTAVPQGIPTGHLPTLSSTIPVTPLTPPVTANPLPGNPQPGNLQPGNPLPPEVAPEPFKPMGIPLPEILKDSPMEKKNK